jgi:hypothetical protein
MQLPNMLKKITIDSDGKENWSIEPIRKGDLLAYFSKISNPSNEYTWLAVALETPRSIEFIKCLVLRSGGQPKYLVGNVSASGAVIYSRLDDP